MCKYVILNKKIKGKGSTVSSQEIDIVSVKPWPNFLRRKNSNRINIYMYMKKMLLCVNYLFICICRVTFFHIIL